MQMFAYAALFEPGDEPGIVVATFPDIPEAITEGDGPAEARQMAADALGNALLAYVRMGRSLPKPSAKGEKIAVTPEVAAKLAVLVAFASSGLSKRELARRLGKDDKEVRRILDAAHPTKIGALSEALGVLGHRLVIGIEKLPDIAA